MAIEPMDPRDAEATARARLDPTACAYFEGGNGEGSTLRENREAWNRVSVLPRVLRNVASVGTSTVLFGRSIAAPVAIAPTAMHRFAHPEGECETAKGAALAGCPLTVSMLATRSVEDIAAAAPEGEQWIQAYLLTDRSRTRDLIERGLQVGCSAVVLSVDGAATPRRANLPGGFLQPPKDFRYPNILPDGSSDGAEELAAAVASFDRAVTFDDISTVKEWCRGTPLLIKGLLRADDAARCVDAGADGVIVSNHGGRQLDGVAATADALPSVARAIGDRATVLVDGGVRTGIDIVRAISLGASAVMVGRPAVWGLGACGAQGVAAVLADLTQDLARAMAFCGAADISDLDEGLIADNLISPR